MSRTRFIVVAGGVISGVGKGVVTASIGKIMQMHGFSTTLIKIDPYVNVDAGTLRPTEHGEVWVTEQGGEIDQDLGTYERFMGIDIPKINNITTGQIYQTVIERERAGEYLGQTVQFIPHITDEIINRIKTAAHGYDIAVIEIGGTVGDYENVPFLCALKALEREIGNHHVVYSLVTYLPVPSHLGEMKTKPTQQAIRLLGEQGIIPDVIMCRAQEPLDEVRKKKIELVAHVPAECIIDAPNVACVYEVPIAFEKQQLGSLLLKLLGLENRNTSSWSNWEQKIIQIIKPSYHVPIAIIGKYLNHGDYQIADSYISIDHALTHAGSALKVRADIAWLDAKMFEDNPAALAQLDNYAGIIIPGGFGSAGVEGKIAAIAYARTHNIPFLGLCYGFQLAVVEYARNMCHLIDAHTTEVNPNTLHPVIDLLPLQQSLLEQHRLGGTMRLGTFKAHVAANSRVATLYKQYNGHIEQLTDDIVIAERHRHRYEVNPVYVDILKQHGFHFSGYCQRSDGTRLMEFGELADHRFFIGTQAHPEFKSRFEEPHPLYVGFLQASLQKQQEAMIGVSQEIMHEQMR